MFIRNYSSQLFWWHWLEIFLAVLFFWRSLFLDFIQCLILVYHILFSFMLFWDGPEIHCHQGCPDGLQWGMFRVEQSWFWCEIIVSWGGCDLWLCTVICALRCRGKFCCLKDIFVYQKYVKNMLKSLVHTKNNLPYFSKIIFKKSFS